MGGPSASAAPAFAFAFAFPEAFLGGPSASAAPYSSAFAPASPAISSSPSSCSALAAAFGGGGAKASAALAVAGVAAFLLDIDSSPTLAMRVSRPDDGFAVCVGDGVFSSARAPEGSGVATADGESSITLPQPAFGVVGVGWPGGTESGEAFIDT